ncbi:TonB-dependent receptor [Paracidobacterium acidisoli]|nr:carboxypeptidase regulatory-like domain-containing protein [Paracidobacterium acidisoli]MBT9331617.1 carboxypeptidase regulatory-like domain-containing protein [Paracidobacterium acidisoli]
MFRRFLSASLLFLALSPMLYAQSNYATLRGSVMDGQRHIIPNAHVKVTASATGATRELETDSAGLYVAEGLQPGAYQVEISSAGFAAATESIQLEVGQQVTLDKVLAVGAQTQTYFVGANPELLKTADASVGEVVDRRSVQQLPLNGRQLIDLVSTVPGAHVSMGAQEGNANPLYWRPGQFSAISISGNRPNANYFLLDGATNTDPTFNTQNLNPNPDIVQEFQVETGSYTAEMGGAGGGQINIATRSGTSVFHGTAYEFLRNGAFDAYSFGAMGATKHLVQNDYGAAVGGPLYGKHTFFFVNYEGYRHVATDAMTDTVPTAAEASGDFSQSGVDIYDPNSTYANPDYNAAQPVSASNPQFLRKQFEYNGQLNVIPPDRISSVANVMLQKYVPQPNQMSGMSMGMTMNGQPGVVGAGNDANNYLDLRNEQHYTDQGTLRVDHDFSKGSSAFLRYSAQGEHGFMPENLPGFGYYHDNLAQQGVLGWSYILSEHMLNISSLAISRLSMDHTTESANKNDIVSELGIQGVGFGGPGAWGAPYFTVQGYSPFGDSFSATPMHAWDTILEGRDTLSWQAGRHSFKFGGAYQWYIWPMWGFFQNRGYYQFTNGFTTHTLTSDGTGSGLASFLLGMPVVRQRQAGVPQMNLRQWYADGFAQDTWRMTNTTTLDYGVRYEYMSPLWDITYTNSNLTFNDGVPSPFIGGQGGYPKGLMYPNKANFAPRLGLAQSVPGMGLVVHVAYGIFYTPVDMNTWCNQRHNIPYVFPETAQSDNYTPTTAITNFNFGDPVLGKTVVSFTALDLHAPAQYVQQWSTSIEKSLGRETTLEVGYLGSRGFHLQRAHLINNAQPGPGAIQPRRPHTSMSFVAGTVLPKSVTVANQANPLLTPVSTINLLENTAQSWYDAGYVNLRRRYANGLSLLANYTFAKSLEGAPDFRSPMYESAIPQNDNDLKADKGPACDIRDRFSLSGVYDVPSWAHSRLTALVTKDWRFSTIYQIQTGYPLTISVFGDTANAGTALGENPIRGNYTGQKIFPHGTHNAMEWFNTAAFAAPPAYTFGNVGRNSVYGPGLQSLDLAVVRAFHLTERYSFETRGEFFNSLNKVNLDTPNRFVNTAGFGTITDAMNPGRQIQLSARISF